MEPQNLLVIMSDEHSIKALGRYGDTIAHTPNLDALASRGTRFASTYCCDPVCIPARATFATGRHTHVLGYWDNADPYDGSVKSWHHHLRERGHRVESIGKLHFRTGEDDNGFDKERIAVHVIDGKSDLLGLTKRPNNVKRSYLRPTGGAMPSSLAGTSAFPCRLG